MTQRPQHAASTARPVPEHLFHGSSRRIEGAQLLPALPSGDEGDPDFPVVFASDCLDFAALFSVKTAAVTHLSSGSRPQVIVTHDRQEAPDPVGQVHVVDSAGFHRATTRGSPIKGKWWCSERVPIDPHRAIAIGGRGHLLRLGVTIVHVRLLPHEDRLIVSRVADALKAPSSESEWWAKLEDFARSGRIASFETQTHRTPLTSSQRELDLGCDAGRTQAFNAHLEHYFDATVCSQMPLQTRVRLIHGIDHACRTALLCRMLHNLLVGHRLIQPLPNIDLAALMATAFFHDAARSEDAGPDHSSSASAAFAAKTLVQLGYGPERARLAHARIEHEHRIENVIEIGAAILQSADAFELMRNYVGDIWLSKTALFRVLQARCPAAIPSYERVALKYAEWLKQIEVWGLVNGQIRVSNGASLQVSDGPHLNAVEIYRRNLGVTPFSDTRAALRANAELDALFDRDETRT